MPVHKWHTVNVTVFWRPSFSRLDLSLNSFLLSSHSCDIVLSLVIHPLSLIIHPSLIHISVAGKNKTRELIGVTPLRHLNQSVAFRLAACHKLNASCMENIMVL